MEQRRARVWRLPSRCGNGHEVTLRYTLPDYGDADALYQCRHCGEILIVNPDSEFYVGPHWDELRLTTGCPTCHKGLERCLSYPSSFRCPECGCISLFGDVLPTAIPDDSESEALRGWDPYR